jgi:phosphoglucosamine mutase
MRKQGYNFGGEQSGHLVFLDHATTGDGIVAALRVLAVMVRENKPLSELAKVMERTPQVLVNLAVEKKIPLDQLPDVQKLIADVERQLGADGRVLVRYSGTESKVRVMIEGMDQSRIQTWADEIAGALGKACRA